MCQLLGPALRITLGEGSVRLVMSYELLEMSGPELRGAGTALGAALVHQRHGLEGTDQHLVTHWVQHQASALGSELGDALGPELGEAPPGVVLGPALGSAGSSWQHPGGRGRDCLGISLGLLLGPARTWGPTEQH
jgi:hypothetical protein